MKTIQSVAVEIYKNMIMKKRNDESKYYSLNEAIAWQQDIIRASHLDRLPSDDIYDRINTILAVLSDLDVEDNEDVARDILYTIEPDCYTSDLMIWLSSNTGNVYYLTEAIEQGVVDGIGALAMAQSCYIQDIGNDLIKAIVEYIETLEEE